MIKDIEIENFRCFPKLKVSGFEKINLISGKNNVGKTALLEALFLNSTPRPEAIFLLRQIRREQSGLGKALPERTWVNFFFSQNKDSKLSIKTILEGESSKTVEAYVDESFKDFPEESYHKDNDDEEKEKLTSLFSGSESVLSVLHLKTIIDPGEAFETLIASSAKGLLARDIKVPDIKSAFFIPSSLRVSNRDLTSEYDKARLNDKDSEVLKAFQSIDSSIIKVESFSIGEPAIYLTRQNESRLPLSLFGDAINRIADIILRIVNNQNSILVIDEIENGIHHSNQVYFWDILFKLSNELNVQIFATTHSLEMLQAFIKSGNKNQELAAHFELVRQANTGQIIAVRRDLETLEYGINHDREVRGE